MSYKAIQGSCFLRSPMHAVPLPGIVIKCQRPVVSKKVFTRGAQTEDLYVKYVSQMTHHRSKVTFQAHW